MRQFAKTIGGVAVAATILLGPAAFAMSRQAAPVNSDGSSKLVDPDEAVERMAEQRSGADPRVVRPFSDSAMDARDAVRPQVAHGFNFRPFR